MRKLKRVQGWSVRPQAWVVLFAASFVFYGAIQGLGAQPGPSVPPLSTSQQQKHSEKPTGSRPVTADCAKVPCLVLSFDDGPDPVTTPQVLDILDHHHARANFFVLGSRAAAMPDLLRRMHRSGHEVGNHSWSHANLTKLTPEQIQAEISQTQAAVIAAGLPVPRLFRPPYGAVNEMVKSHIPLSIALWNVDPEDWHTTDPSKLVQKVVADAKPGGVVVMHDVEPVTVVALPTILQTLQAQYQLVTMSELLSLPPGQQGEFFGRWHP